MTAMTIVSSSPTCLRSLLSLLTSIMIFLKSLKHLYKIAIKIMEGTKFDERKLIDRKRVNYQDKAGL